jgi:hypothetical protein
LAIALSVWLPSVSFSGELRSFSSLGSLSAAPS